MMYEALLEEANRLFPNKGFLTLEEVCQLLECEAQTVYNWGKRTNPKRRPPRLMIGKTLRFPKVDFMKWLVQEQLASGGEQ